MHVFLSYPPEFIEVAEALYAELTSRKIDTFYDKKAIRPGDDWQHEIEASIKEANVFVVLYSPEAANTSKFYSREIERIEATCEKGLQRVIPVIFNPTKIVDVPVFYQQHQLITSETEGKVKEKKDDYWIAQIAQELERLKVIRDKLKQRQIISRSAQALGAITIVLLSISLFNTKTALVDKKEFLSSRNENVDGETECHSLLGNYRLGQSYVFKEGEGVKAVATEGKWKAQSCVPKSNGGFILEGTEETDFDIQAMIDGKYERIATAKYIYGSEVYIRKDGTPVGRTFDASLDSETLTKLYKDGRVNNFNKPVSFLDKKIDEFVELRDIKNRNTKTNPCIPMLGETGGNTAVAFVCEGYTRTMVKVPSSGPLADPPEGEIPLADKEGYKVVLGADANLKLPGVPGELRVWIGSPYVIPNIPNDMIRRDIVFPPIGETAKITAKITPFAPAFEIEPKESICMGVHPTGSESRFKLRPTRIGTFNVGADVQLFNAPECRGAPSPKWTDTLQVTVEVNSDEAFQERTKQLGEIFWEKLKEFWGFSIALFFALLLFLIRGRLKKWFSFGDDK
ncbi:MAG: toll/interleukin-1 receptor domain-containing protein [Chitinophagaceae bacterium]